MFDNVANLQVGVINTISAERHQEDDRFRIITQRVEQKHFAMLAWSFSTFIWIFIVISACILCNFMKSHGTVDICNVKRAYEEAEAEENNQEYTCNEKH
jgi:hypothetical protein